MDSSKVHTKSWVMYVGGRWQSGAGDCRDVRLFSRLNNASGPKGGLPVGRDGSTETTYSDRLCRSQGNSLRQFAKRTFQDTESEMRAQKARQAKSGQDKPSQGIRCQIPYERARKAICCFWGSAELLLVSRNVEDGRSLRANNARPISGEAAVLPLPLHPQNSSKQAR